MKKSLLRKIIRSTIIESFIKEGHCYDEDGKPMPESHCYEESLNEQGIPNVFDNPPPGAGGGPNWQAAANDWANFFSSGGAAGTAPSPPQPFLDRMATMGCGGKISRFNVLNTKFFNLFAPAPGQSVAPNNPLWQSQLAAKLVWLGNDLMNNCSSSL